MEKHLTQRLKRRLRRWTESMAGADLGRRLLGERCDSEYGVDPFGFSLEYALSAVAPLVWLYQHYFRVEAVGIEKVPPGRVLLVANHSGQLPFDGAMIAVALLTKAQPARVVRTMVMNWVPTLPFISTLFARVGQIVGTPENCRRLLEKEEAILVFPEGQKALSKMFKERYELKPFGLGFMRLALETHAPVVPVAVIGAEEQAPAVVDVKPLAKLLGFPAFPMTPWGLPVPLPTKYRLYFGDPLTFSGRSDDDDADLEKKVSQVRSTLQRMVDEGLAARKAVFW